MATVTVNLTGYEIVASVAIGWLDNVSIGSTFDRNGLEQTLDYIQFQYTAGFGAQAGFTQIYLTGVGDRFTPEFEAAGRIIVTASDGETVEFMIAGADMSEPYEWQPTNSVEIAAFANHVRGLTDHNATLTLTDDPPHTDHAVDAGAVTWTFALPQPTVTHTPAPGTLLLLADFDDTDLTVDAAALLTASAPGTTGNNPYADSDRGGSDSPTDGELGLSPTDTVISRIRRHSDTELNLNDNDSPSALDLGTYFGVGGDGNDLTLYLQTSADGLASFAVAAQIGLVGGNFARFTLPADAQTLLDNISTGDRFIFAFARPASVSVDHAVDAGNVAWSFALPEPTVTHTSVLPIDHAVDAGAVSWVYDLPQPTVTHTPATSGDEVSVTVPLTGESVFDDYIRWSDNYSLGSLFDANGEEQVLSLVDLNNAGPPGLVRISITGTNNRFTPEFEATGRFTFTASDGESVTVVLANADMSEIYQWTPANSDEVVAFVLHVKSLTDQTGTLTLTGEGTATPTDHAGVDAGPM